MFTRGYNHCDTSLSNCKVASVGLELSFITLFFECVFAGVFQDKVVNILPGKGSWLGEFFDPAEPDDYWETPRSHRATW